jgi:DNA-binding SARP family transcriptional activator
MEFRILGGVDVLAEGQQLPLGGPRQRALLAYLLLHADETVSADRLLEELWYEPPHGGVAAVQTQVSRLRRALGGRIATTGTGYRIELERDELDLDRFRALLAQAAATPDADERSRVLRSAEELWRGPPLDGLEAPFAAAEAHALEELRLASVEARLDADLQAGGNGELVSELSNIVARHPLRERFREQLILALYRNGRQAEALDAYQAARRMLNDEFGLEPGPALRDLERAILRHDPSLAAAAQERDPSPPDREAPPRALRPVLAGAAVIVLLAAGATAAVLVNRTGSPDLAPAASTDVPTALSSTTSRLHRPLTSKLRSHTHRTTRLSVHRVSRSARTTTQHSAVPRTAPAIVVVTTMTASRPAARNQAKATTNTRSEPTKTSTTTKTTTAKAPRHVPSPVTIADAFGGPAIDGTIWYQIRQGTGWDFSQHDGQLEFSFPAGTTPGPPNANFGGQVGTLCKFPGDFDARVDYSLPKWPAQNGIALNLWALLGPGNQPWDVRRQSSAEGGDEVGSSTGPGVDTALPISDPAGTLRIARHASVVTAYFLHGGRWVSLTSGRSTAWATIAVGAQGAGPSPVFGGQPAVADFDNFRVSAPKAVCPPGSGGHS